MKIRMTISRKLFAGFLAVLLLLSGIVLASSTQLTKVSRTYSKLMANQVNHLILVQRLDVNVKQEVISLRGNMILGDDASVQNFNQAHQDYADLSKRLHNNLQLQEARDILTRIDQIESEYMAFSKQVFQLRAEKQTEAYTNLISTQGREIIKRFDAQIQQLTDFLQSRLDEEDHSTIELADSAKNWTIGMGLAAILLGVVIALYMGRLISKPIIALSRSAKIIASGDLTVDEMKVRQRDEIGELSASFNQMSRSLRQLIVQVSIHSEQVAASSEQLTASAEQTGQASEQIAHAMQEAAIGVEQQLRSLEVASHTIQDIMGGVQEIAARSHDVSTKAADASNQAKNGSEAVRLAVGQMNTVSRSVAGLEEIVTDLSERTGQISSILEQMSGLAAQTKILSLNASIEAARSGEHGRGFAVVAGEIRKLADQSALYAQHVTELLSGIQTGTGRAVQAMTHASQEVMEGSGLVREAETAFLHIEDTVLGVTSQIIEVSAAVQQMSAGTDQMVGSMKVITQVAETSTSSTHEVSAATQEQLASMEEMSTASTALASLAEELQGIVGKFKV